MKRLFFILISTLFCAGLLAQCPTSTVYLSTQTEIDNFAANYSGCTEVPVNINIQNSNGSINNTITNLDGLSHITSVRSIGTNYCYALESIEGLQNLSVIQNNLTIKNTQALTNLTGLENLTSLGASIYIENNPALNDISAFANLDSIPFDFLLDDNDALSSIAGLNGINYVGRDIEITRNLLLSQIDGFNNITSLDDLILRGNSALNDFTGFSNLTNIASLNINGNLVNHLNAFSNLNSISERIFIRSNSLTDIAGLSNADILSMTSLTIRDSPALAVCSLPNICDYLLNGGTHFFSNNANGCDSYSEIIVNCTSEFCLNDGITFTTQTQIDNFATDYAGCVEVLGDVTIDDSGADPITNLDGLSQITSIEGSLTIQNNPSLTNLNGLANITAIEGTFAVNNNTLLNDISGIESIDFVNVTDVQIQNNPSLSVCNMPNICAYVSFNTATISGNASGCNTAAQIVASCAPADGTLDTDFGTNGVINITGNNVSCILTQPDDKIIVFGSSVLRLHPDGTLDTSFGTNGVASFTGYEGVLQPDGKIVVLSTYALARLNSDGTFDTTFGTGGTQPLIVAAKDIALSPDGKIVTSDTELARYNADGSVDTSFGNNGVVSIEVQAYHLGEYPGSDPVLETYHPSCHVVVKSDGKIVVAGDFAYQSRYNPYYIIYYNRLRMRSGYNADGTPDNNFNDWIEGWYQGDVYSSVDDLLLLPDDEFVMLSSTDFETEGDLCMNQYDANGTALGGNCDYVPLCEDSFYYGASWSKATVADCGIFAFGEYGTIFGNTCEFLTRTDYDGTPNNDFGDNGGVPLPLAAAFNNTADIALQSDGGIIVVGNSATGIALARLHNDEACNPIFPITTQPPTDPCGGAASTDSLTHIFDQDLFIDGVGFANNPTVTFTDPGTPADAVLSDISLELYFRLNSNTCENEIAIQLTDPAGNTQALNAFASCDGGTGLYYVNLNVPNGNTIGSVADWVVEFDDTNDQNSDYEYSVRFARLNYVATTGGGGETIINEVSEFADSDLFIDGVGFANNGNYTFTDPGTPANAVLSDISLELYFRLNGASCENEIALQITDPAGNTQALTAYTTCDGGTGLYYVNLDVPAGNTTGSVADWVVEFDDTNDQNSDYEYSVRFGRLTYTTTHTEGGGGMSVTVNDSVSDFADSDLFIDGVGFANNGNYTFTDPGTPADAVLSNISLELYFRLNGSSCENEIALQITDPAGNTQPLTAYTTCDGGTGLYYVNLDVPSGNTTGNVADWLVEFDDINDQNSDYEYSVRFGRLTYDVEYTECVPMLVNENDESQQLHNSSIHQLVENVNSSTRQLVNTLKLYPVPASQHLKVEYFSETSNSTNIEIISNEGKTLMQKASFSQEGINTIQLDIAELPVGHYHIRMYSADDVQMQSFVKIMP